MTLPWARILWFFVFMISCGLNDAWAEPSASEAEFLEVLANALGHESEDVRSAAALSLGAMGSKSAHYLVRAVGRLSPRAQAGAVDVLIELGVHARGAILELDGLPDREEDRRLLGEVASALGIGAGFGFGREDLRAKRLVDDVISGLPRDVWISDHPGLDRIVQEGRRVIPSLVRYLDPERADSHRLRVRWAQTALLQVCDARDVHALGRLLDMGWGSCASILGRIGDARAVPYLIRALGRRELTRDLGNALKGFCDPRAREPAVAFLERLSGFPEGMMPLLEMLVAMRASEALPHLRRIESRIQSAPRFLQARMLMMCGRALAALGDKLGVEMLIQVLDAQGLDRWLVAYAGDALNAVTGQSFWQSDLSAVKARKQYKAWWSENEAELVWSEDLRRFVRKES